MKSIARSVRLFLVDGSASGIITAEVVNWTGHLLVAPRAHLAEVLERPEANKTGVYFLFSELSELGGRRPVYIGESDDVGRRLGEHSRNAQREFERFCIVTSKDLNLTKAHARYLENRLTTIASLSGRSEILNGLTPTAGILPESDVADMEYFVEQVRLVLPVLGYDVLKEPFVINTNEVKAVSEVRADIEGQVVSLRLQPNGAGIEANAVEKDGEILVLAGSKARAESLGVSDYPYRALRERMIADGTLVYTENRQFRMFESDTVFRSPSAAASVIFGRSTNGRTSWLISETGQTLADFQNERLLAE